MKSYCVYILLCSDGSFYTGVTSDFSRRFYEHQVGLHTSCYTFSRRPVVSVYTSEFADPCQAIAWEKQVKRWTRKKKQALIEGKETLLHAYAEYRNSSNAKRRTVMVSGDEPGQSGHPSSSLRVTTSGTYLNHVSSSPSAT